MYSVIPELEEKCQGHLPIPQPSDPSPLPRVGGGVLGVWPLVYVITLWYHVVVYVSPLLLPYLLPLILPYLLVLVSVCVSVSIKYQYLYPSIYPYLYVYPYST